MSRDPDAARLKLATALARRLAPALPAGYADYASPGLLARQTEWIFDDAANCDIPLDQTLARAALYALETLQSDVGRATTASWPPARMSVPPTNRHPWARVRHRAIELGYGEGDTAAFALEPIAFEELELG